MISFQFLPDIMNSLDSCYMAGYSNQDNSPSENGKVCNRHWKGKIAESCQNYDYKPISSAHDPSIVSPQAECLSLGSEIAGKLYPYNCRNPDLPGDVTCKKDAAYDKDILVAVNDMIKKITSWGGSI
jgi:hypothetical protein